jgi:hypothetical protein
MRARWYSASNARWERLDPFAGNPNDPFSFNKYGFVHGDPVQGIDPTGMFSFSIGSLSVSITLSSAISFGAGSLASYAIGKGIEAAYLQAVEGDLSNFRWFTAWDLLSFVPGGFLAAAYAKFVRYPIALLTRGPTGKVVGKMFAQGGHLNMAAAFGAKYGTAGYNLSRTFIDNGVQRVVKFVLPQGGKHNGFAHIIRRHMAEYYDGSVQGALQGPTGFWPVGTSADDVIRYVGDAVYTIVSIPKVLPGAANNLVSKDVLLKNGISARIVFDVVPGGDVLIHTFFPLNGPGVTTVQEIIAKNLL